MYSINTKTCQATCDTLTLQLIRDFFNISEDNTQVITFFNQLIHNSNNYNIIEKFIILLKLRSLCVDSYITIHGKNIDVDTIIDMFDGIQIKQNIFTYKDVTYTLDIPRAFYTGAPYDYFNSISKIQYGDTTINVDNLAFKDKAFLFDNINTGVSKYIDSFLAANKSLLKYNLRLTRDITLVLDFNTISVIEFLKSVFLIFNQMEFREYVFTLSKRLDINFILSSTFMDTQDYYSLYRREVESNEQPVANL